MLEIDAVFEIVPGLDTSGEIARADSGQVAGHAFSGGVFGIAHEIPLFGNKDDAFVAGSPVVPHIARADASLADAGPITDESAAAESSGSDQSILLDSQGDSLKLDGGKLFVGDDGFRQIWPRGDLR